MLYGTLLNTSNKVIWVRNDVARSADFACNSGYIDNIPRGTDWFGLSDNLYDQASLLRQVEPQNERDKYNNHMHMVNIILL